MQVQVPFLVLKAVRGPLVKGFSQPSLPQA
jgi:hypothetical protein